ncbi:MAG: ATP-binding protein [Bacteroidales bacterium]|nr:ATP-binding protein [Bacteroidales bacterium]
MPIKIVLTGGPCAGKSTILKRIVQKYSTSGYKVYTLPEAATQFIQGGVDFLTQDVHLSFVTETAKLQYQLAMEDSMMRIAEACGQPAMIICDRGSMDTFAYISEQVKRDILSEIGQTETELCDHRYDAVLHICTAAKGAEAFYTLDNNNCRSESIEVARKVDDRLLSVWEKHPRLNIIQANVDFEKKINDVLIAIDKILESTQTDPQR